MSRPLGLAWVLLLLVACGKDGPDPTDDDCFLLPAGSHLPRFAAAQDRLLLSYVASRGEAADTLYTVSRTERSDWSPPRRIAQGSDWFVNWADFPSVAPYRDSLGAECTFAHWLAYSGEGTYDYDIRYNDRGPERNILAAKLHRDTVSAEHGFLSSAALPGGGLRVTWLDGRHTKTPAAGAAAPGEDHDHGHGPGAMSLRSAVLNRGASTELDDRVCDCCATATVATEELTLVAYRDRSEEEIRDISFVTHRDGAWSAPAPVHVDNWEISGCPVNGPALAANALGDIAVAWYTAAGDVPRVQFARYNVESDAFGTPVTIDNRNPLGRLDLQLAEDGTAYLLGLAAAAEPDSANLTLWTIDNLNQFSGRVVTTTAAARSSGFPRLARWRDDLYTARTVTGSSPRVEVCRLARGANATR